MTRGATRAPGHEVAGTATGAIRRRRRVRRFGRVRPRLALPRMRGDGPGRRPVGYGLGVDLGTTFTAAAVERDGRVEMVTLGDRSAAVPSVVLLRDDGTVLTGDAADRRAATEPDRVAREVKRRLGDPMPLMLGGDPVLGRPGSWRLQLRDVVQLVTEREGARTGRGHAHPPRQLGPVQEGAVQPDPAHGGPARRPDAHRAGGGGRALRVERASRRGCTRRGLRPRRRDVRRGRAAHDRAGFEILGTPEGIEGLGGIDFDEAVFDHVDRSLGGRCPSSTPTIRATPAP